MQGRPTVIFMAAGLALLEIDARIGRRTTPAATHPARPAGISRESVLRDEWFTLHLTNKPEFRGYTGGLR